MRYQITVRYHKLYLFVAQWGDSVSQYCEIYRINKWKILAWSLCVRKNCREACVPSPNLINVAEFINCNFNDLHSFTNYAC